MLLCNITPQLQIKRVKADSVTSYVYPGESIQTAINSANPGDKIFVHNGVYKEGLTVDVEGLTLEGEDKLETIIDANFLQNTIEVTASSVIIRNFTIKYAEENGVFIENINHLVLENCNIENNGAFGIYISASDELQTTNSNIISNCEIFENYYSGIRIDGISHVDANTIINCEFYDNGYGAMQDNARAAISIIPINGMVSYTTIRNCLFCCSFDFDIYIDGNTVENTLVYHNNFMSNTVIYSAFDTGNNFWYNQTFGQGNYWNDYIQKYPDANDLNGVWDTPYEIYGGVNQDLYPLVNPVVLERPIANANGPYTANIGDMIVFDGSDSYDPDSTFLFYEWHLGNGQILHGQTVSYAYSSAGTYTVTLTVEDYHGLTDSNITFAIIKEPEEDSGGGGGGSGDGDGVFPPENNPPISNANGPYYGITGAPVLFNGSFSTDDGEILNYTWDFGDTEYGYGISSTHIYKQIGVYNCKLIVTDENNENDTDLFKVFITHPNSQPTIPEIQGPKSGHINIEYNFTVVSTDSNNDTIRYNIIWDDGSSNISKYVSNNTIVQLSHFWSTEGVYNIKVFAEDNKNYTSPNNSLLILIDVIVIFIDDVIEGYLLDNDMDGVFDMFHNNITSIETAVQKQNDNTYLIDSDNDGDWEYSFNSTEKLKEYQEIINDKSDETSGFGVVIILISLSIILILYERKK